MCRLASKGGVVPARIGITSTEGLKSFYNRKGGLTCCWNLGRATTGSFAKVADDDPPRLAPTHVKCMRSLPRTASSPVQTGHHTPDPVVAQ